MTMHPAPRPTNFRPENFRPDGFAPALAGVGGYQVISQDSPDADATKTIVAELAAGTDSYLFTGANDSIQYIYISAVSACGIGDGEPVRPKLRRVAFDGSGNLINEPPNEVQGLRASVGAGGDVTVHFTWIKRGDIDAVSFNVYVAEGAAAFNYGSADANVSLARDMSYTHNAANGTTVKFVVRAVAASGAEDPNTTEVSAVADDVAPAAPDDLVVEVIG